MDTVELMTEYGCRVRILPAPAYHPKGVLLELAIPEQNQRAEVYLNPENAEAFLAGVTAALEEA